VGQTRCRRRLRCGPGSRRVATSGRPRSDFQLPGARALGGRFA
jgi:hypothetical protein